uniref:MYND-type domain-containing protein n=1 Tax=Tetradesmus obliquus TaxID=3088 RepID=A0A383W1C7_TETOB|eukprot:jgi/Sobl393_1/17747/SZX63129.1
MAVQYGSSSSMRPANLGQAADQDPAQQQQGTDSVAEDPLEQQQQQQRASQHVEGVVADVLSFCRVVAAAVPLPEVCNNPSCQCLHGISEAAAAVKMCAGCGTRYCCLQCQQVHWRVHRRACMRLRLQAGSS